MDNITKEILHEIDSLHDDVFTGFKGASKIDKVMADINPGIHKECSMDVIKELLGY